MCITPYFLKNLGIHVRCGRCIDCKLSRTREWADRMMVENHTMKEKYQYPGMSITLTYDKEHLPKNKKGQPTLDKDAVPKFFKRLRKRIWHKIKYYYCGEYGAKRGRPHYHVILMGVHPALHKNFIRAAWGQGYVHFDPIVQRTVAYAAGYVQKKVYSKNNEYYINKDKVPPFSNMSKGIGKDYCLANADSMIANGGYRINGYMRALPRYFRKLLGVSGLTEKALEAVRAKEQYIVERAKADGIKFCFMDEFQLHPGIDESDLHDLNTFCNQLEADGKIFQGRLTTPDFDEYLTKYRNQHRLNLEAKYKLWRTKLCDIIHQSELLSQELSDCMLFTTLSAG